MARPSTGRDERIYIRLTPEEKAAIEDQAALLGLTGADWLRRLGLGLKLPKGKLDAEARRLMLAQLLGMARNTNQLTALAHRSHIDPEGINSLRMGVLELVEKVRHL